MRPRREAGPAHQEWPGDGGRVLSEQSGEEREGGPCSGEAQDAGPAVNETTANGTS